MSTAVGYSGINSFAFFIDEAAGYGRGGYGGTILVPVAPDAGDQHIPFNPLESLEWENPKYETLKLVLLGDSTNTVISTKVAEGTMTLNTIYHAPFILSRVFGTTTSGVWAANDSATIDYNMTNYMTTTSSICTHVHLDNRQGSDDIDLNLYGGTITSYKWTVADGEVLRESVSISYNQFDESAIPMNADANYHNGRFALWNSEYLTDQDDVIAIGQHKISITTTTLIDADVAVYSSAEINLIIPQMKKTGLGYEQVMFNAKTAYDITATMNIIPKGKQPLDEVASRIESRSTIPFRIQISNGTTTEYLQCTKMRLETIGQISIPKAQGDAVMGLSCNYIATRTSELTYSGTFVQATTTNPQTYINRLA